MTYKTKAERDAVIESNLPLVVSRVKKLNKGVFDEDLFQIGCMGLIEAADKYDESKGCVFSTIAVICIDGSICRYRNRTGLIKPRMKQGEYIRAEVLSLDAPVGDGNLTFGQIMPDGAGFEDEVIGKTAIESFISQLSGKERTVMELSMKDKISQRVIAEVVGTSQPTVSKIKRAIYQKYVKMFGHM